MGHQADSADGVVAHRRLFASLGIYSISEILPKSLENRCEMCIRFGGRGWTRSCLFELRKAPDESSAGPGEFPRSPEFSGVLAGLNDRPGNCDASLMETGRPTRKPQSVLAVWIASARVDIAAHRVHCASAGNTSSCVGV